MCEFYGYGSWNLKVYKEKNPPEVFASHYLSIIWLLILHTEQKNEVFH